MANFDLDKFMGRVDGAGPNQLATLKQNFADYGNSLAEPERQLLIKAYMERMHQRSASIKEQMEQIRHEKISA